MNIPQVVRLLLLGFGVSIAILGTLGMFGFGPGESIVVLCVLACIDYGLRRVDIYKRDRTK